MSPPPEAADQVGAATLERMAAAPRYNRWMFDRLRPWVGRRVLEIGAGIGNMSAFFADRERVVLTDTESYYLGRLRQRFADRPHVSVAELRRSEEHTSELQSPSVISYAVFCLKKKK